MSDVLFIDVYRCVIKWRLLLEDYLRLLESHFCGETMFSLLYFHTLMVTF